MKIEKLLSIIVLLLNKKRISAKELASRYEVTTRTIYRYMETISAAGIPIVSYQGVNGGWGIMESYRLDKQVLSFDDMKSLLTTLIGVNQTIEDKNIENIIDKIISISPQNDNFIKYSEEYAIDITPWGMKKNSSDILKKIQQAISSKKIINFYYENLNLEISNRKVEPMTLVYKGYAWYLFAYCLLRNDYRIFKLNRIQDLIITESQFIRKSTSYKTYFDNNFEKPTELTLLLKFNPKLLNKVNEYFNENIKEIDQNGFIFVEVEIPNAEWIYNMIFSFGEMVEVLSPKEIREEIPKRLEKILAHYKYDIVLSH